MKACPASNACPLFSAPAVVADLIFFGGGEGNFYAATTEGVMMWSSGTGGLVASGPAISHSMVFVGSYDGFVHAYSLDGK